MIWIPSNCCLASSNPNSGSVSSTLEKSEKRQSEKPVGPPFPDIHMKTKWWEVFILFSEGIIGHFSQVFTGESSSENMLKLLILWHGAIHREEPGATRLQLRAAVRLLSGQTDPAKNVTHSDTALAPQSNTFPAKRPLTRANCLSSQFSCSMDWTAFR